VYRKSDSAILVVKSAKDRLGCDDAEALNRPTYLPRPRRMQCVFNRADGLKIGRIPLTRHAAWSAKFEK
jgi:hypothetical protein